MWDMFCYLRVGVYTHASHSTSENWPRSGAMWRLPRLKAAAGLRGFGARARGVLVLWDERRGFGKAGLAGLVGLAPWQFGDFPNWGFARLLEGITSNHRERPQNRS